MPVTRSARVRALRRSSAMLLVMVTTVAMALLGGVAGARAASSVTSPLPVNLGSAASFAVLASSTVTNTGATTVTGNLGVSPGSAVTGFPPGKVVDGTEYIADPTARQAQSDLTAAYNDAAGRAPNATVSGLGGRTFGPGVYHSASSMSLTGTVTLDGKGDPSAVFIFQAASTLVTASSSTVDLIGGAQACNVFWQVGSSATLGTGTAFAGSILALASVTVTTGASVEGRALARTAAVTLDDNAVTKPTTCLTSPTTTTTTSSTTTTPPPTTTTTTTPGGATTTTLTATTVPGTHTGEPWAGWPYWAFVGLAGLAGVAVMERAVRVRRRRE